MYITRGCTLEALRSCLGNPLEKLENSQHNVVCVTETGGLGLLCVVETARPVYAHGIQTQIDARRSVYTSVSTSTMSQRKPRTQRGATIQLTKVENALKHGIVVVVHCI